MKFIYNIGLLLASFHIKLIALFNTKLKQGVIGRAEVFKKLEAAIKITDKVFWFHCASLGEYEQGLPVFEQLRIKYPDYKVVLSFFSPSGYEIRKNSPIADVVVYLPIDTVKNAKRFLDLVHPDYTIFVKYEIWPNFLTELRRRRFRAILISGLFREDQIFFKPYGSFMAQALFAFEHIFVQNSSSKELLKKIGYSSVSISGDTRFDRVYNQLDINNKLDFIDRFKKHNLCIVFGSTWPEDDKLILPFINQLKESVKFIIAPHNIKQDYINSIRSQITKRTILYSELKEDLSSYDVLILDTIGLLSKTYSYADIAYVGGAAGKTGLHNILEPAVFGVPIVIGKNHNKFPEATQLITLGGVVDVDDSKSLESVLNKYVSSKNSRQSVGAINKDFINKNKGAVIQILQYIRI